MREQRQARSRPRIVLGNAMILGMILGFLLVPLIMAGWWLSTVYGLVGMSTFFGTTEGTMLSSKVVRHADSEDGDTWEVRLRYRYEVGGRTYEGYRYNPSFGGGFNQQASAQRVVDGLPPGKKVTVHYDPLMPSQSALTSDLYADSLKVGPSGSGGFSIEGGGQIMVLILVPAFFGLAAWIILRGRRKSARRADRRGGEGGPARPKKDPWRVRFGRWMTRPQGSQLDAFPSLVVLLFGLGVGGGGVWAIATAFRPREASQINMGPFGQCFAGAIMVLIGFGVLGVLLSQPTRD